MPRVRLTARGAVLAAVCAVGAPVAIATASPAAEMRATTTLAGSAAAMTANHPGVGAVSGTESETIEVWMAGQQAAAQRFVDAVSTPGSPTYHQYLSPSAYTQRFGPGAARVTAVRSYLAGEGFTRVHASVNDDYVSATGPVSTINRAFAVQMRRYEVTGAGGRSTTFESNDRGLTVPASISRDILAVTGLNTTQPQTGAATTGGAGASTSSASTANGADVKAAACSKYWAQTTTSFSPAFAGLTEAARPVCGYSAKQIRAAYGLSSADTGAGKTIALIELGSPDKMFRALTDYAKANGLRAPRADQLREEAIGQPTHHGRCLEPLIEEPIDSEAAYAVAPAAQQLIVLSCWTGNNFNQAVLDAELTPLTGHGSRASAAIESTSYGLGAESKVPRSQLKASHAIALRAAAEGVSLLSYSGDTPGVLSEASDPDVTAVGGTTLGVGAHDQRVFETGWSTDFGERRSNSGPWQDQGILAGAGGGASTLYDEPSYQQRVVPRALAQNSHGHAGRTVPDISADADNYTGMSMGYITTNSSGKATPYTPFTGSGTSMSTPLVAGIVADAEQGQPRNLGFLNPLLYSLAGSQAFHDILPLSPSDPPVDRAIYTRAHTYINHKAVPVYQVAINDAQGRGTHQVTAPGYDTVTGLGTPNGSAFIKGLRSGK